MADRGRRPTSSQPPDLVRKPERRLAELTGECERLRARLEELSDRHQRLEEVRKQWTATFDAVDDPIFVHDDHCRIIRANAAYARQAGRPVQELIGKLYWRVFPRCRGPMPGCRLATGTRRRISTEDIVPETGECFHSRSFHSRDSRGYYCVHILQDVTAQRRMQEQLRNSEEQFRAIAATAADAILVLDESGRITLWNRAATRLFGYRAREAMGRDLHELIVPERYRKRARAGLQGFSGTGKGALVGKTVEMTALHKDGTEFPVELSISGFRNGATWQATGIIRDITARKAWEEQIGHLARFPSENPNPVMRTGMHGDLLFANGAAKKLFRRAGIKLTDGVPDLFLQAISRASSTGNSVYVETPLAQRTYAFYVVPIKGEAYINLYGLEITERKNAEASLRSEKDFADSLVETAQTIILILTPEGKIRYFNPYMEEISGYRLAEVQGKDWFDTFLPKQDRKKIRRLFLKAVADSQTRGNINPIITRGGEARFIEWHDKTLKESNGHIVGLLAVGQDITERRQVEMALIASEMRYRQLFNAGNDAVFVHPITANGLPGTFTAVNDLACQRLGYSREELLSLSPLDIDAAEFSGVARTVTQTLLAHGKAVFEVTHVTKDGHKIPVEVSSHLFDYQGQPTVLSMVRDITERKQAEESLRRSRALLDEMGRIARIGGWEFDPQTGQGSWTKEVARIHDMEPTEYTSLEVGLGFYRGEHRRKIEAAVRAAIEHGTPYDLKLEMVTARGNRKWVRTIGRPVMEKGKVVRVAGSFQDITELRQAREQLQASETRLHEIISNLADGIIVIDEEGAIRFLNPAAATMLGRPAGAFLGRKLGLPVITDETCEVDLLRPGTEALPAEMRMVEMRWEGEPANVVSLHDISERRQVEAVREKSNRQIRRSLIGTIDAVARVVEARDPYTAGHQARVANLSVAIARELGWDEQRIEGLRLGAMIHDIGKIQIPAELLAKPSRLTEIEYRMIKTHPEIGYGILKEITFPWPVADIARQHHERLDGSGYPRGLRGKEICGEARIVAVADVVEAIASHRPYRPGLGIEAALTEIETKKGTHYDATAADACLRLFREKGFDFSAT